jgi:hypothetical protein
MRYVYYYYYYFKILIFQYILKDIHASLKNIHVLEIKSFLYSFFLNQFYQNRENFLYFNKFL